MSAVARSGDTTDHNGCLQASQTKVFVGGVPAAVVGDVHVCPLCDGNKPHGPARIERGSQKVLFAGRAAARQGDSVKCGGAAPDRIRTGSRKVMIQ